MSEAAALARDCPKCGGVKTGTHESYCIECYRAYKRQWYLKNREKEIARCSAYNKANPHIPAASMQRVRAKDPEKAREYQREYKAANPQRIRIFDSTKRAKRRAQIGATIHKVTPKQWGEIQARYKHHCAYCLKPFKTLTMDHVVPLARGGDHTVGNIVPACAKCNSAKHARHQLDFVAAKFGRLI